jgi:hypothetical protein
MIAPGQSPQSRLTMIGLEHAGPAHIDSTATRARRRCADRPAARYDRRGDEAGDANASGLEQGLSCISINF